MTTDDHDAKLFLLIEALAVPTCAANERVVFANKEFERLVGCGGAELSNRMLIPGVFRSLETDPVVDKNNQEDRWHLTQTATGCRVRVSVGCLPASPLRIISALPVEAQAADPVLARALEAFDDERRRVARELHDETGQWLTALLVGLQAAEGQAADSKAAAGLRRLRDLTRMTVNELRRLCRGLHPGTLENLGLFAGLGSLADDFSTAHKVQTQLELAAIRDMPRMDGKTEIAVFRLVQEALTNVARHAEANHVRLQATLTTAAMVIELTDDGIGFDSLKESLTSLGLRGMRERAKNIGATLCIDSAPGAGTTISLHIPRNVSSASR